MVAITTIALNNRRMKCISIGMLCERANPITSTHSLYLSSSLSLSLPLSHSRCRYHQSMITKTKMSTKWFSFDWSIFYFEFRYYLTIWFFYIWQHTWQVCRPSICWIVHLSFRLNVNYLRWTNQFVIGELLIGFKSKKNSKTILSICRNIRTITIL